MHRYTGFLQATLLFALFFTNLGISPIISSVKAINPSLENSSNEPQKLLENLRISDLPARFEPGPPFLRQLILKNFGSFQSYFQHNEPQTNNLSIFIDIEQAELVLGMTSHLSTQQAIVQFDQALSRSDNRQMFVQELEKNLQAFGPLKIKQIEKLESSAIGDRSQAFRFQADAQGLPLTIFGEFVILRRNNATAVVVIGSLNQPLDDLRVPELASRLDNRLIDSVWFGQEQLNEHNNFSSFR